MHDAPGEPRGERNDERGGGGEHEERGVPADARDEGRAVGHHRELAEGAACAHDPERDAALLRRNDLGHDAHHHAEGRARKGEADQQARGQVESERRARKRHEDEARHVGDRARDQHAPGAEAVRDRARERHERAPQDVLQRDGEREFVAAPALGHGHLRQEKPHRLAHAHGEHQDQRGADEDGPGRFHRINPARLRRRATNELRAWPACAPVMHLSGFREGHASDKP